MNYHLQLFSYLVCFEPCEWDPNIEPIKSNQIRWTVMSGSCCHCTISYTHTPSCSGVVSSSPRVCWYTKLHRTMQFVSWMLLYWKLLLRIWILCKRRCAYKYQWTYKNKSFNLEKIGMGTPHMRMSNKSLRSMKQSTEHKLKGDSRDPQ